MRLNWKFFQNRRSSFLNWQEDGVKVNSWCNGATVLCYRHIGQNLILRNMILTHFAHPCDSLCNIILPCSLLSDFRLQSLVDISQQFVMMSLQSGVFLQTKSGDWLSLKFPPTSMQWSTQLRWPTWSCFWLTRSLERLKWKYSNSRKSLRWRSRDNLISLFAWHFRKKHFQTFLLLTDSPWSESYRRYEPPGRFEG